MSTFSLALGWWGSVVMLVVIGLSVFGVCMSASVVLVVEGPRWPCGWTWTWVWGGKS